MSEQTAYENGFTDGEVFAEERIIKMIEEIPFIWMGDMQALAMGKDKLLALIRGGNQ